MRAVVDANVVLALALPLPYSPQSAAWWGGSGKPAARSTRRLFSNTRWRRRCERLFRWGGSIRQRPRRLWRGCCSSEWCSFLRRASLDSLALHLERAPGAFKAFDAQYLALAEQMHCHLWTADRRMAAAARQLGAGWVRLVGEDVLA